MASLFRRDPKTRITSMFREVFSEVAMNNPESTLDVTIAATAEICGMVEFDMEGLAERLLGLAQKAAKQVEAKKPSGPRKTGGFGEGFQKWAGSMNTDKLCLWIADYDFQRAEYLYRQVDIDDLQILANMKTEQTWEMMKSQFEACVIGFGGKLQGQSEATVHEVDMNDTSSIDEMVRQMKALGF